MELIAKNITLENIKKSNYWDLIAILIWNHYRDEEEQDESAITMDEQWYGLNKTGSSSSHRVKWNNPSYKEPDYTRTLYSIKITFVRTDYTTYIDIKLDGTVVCIGRYSDPTKKGYLSYSYSSLDVVNWLCKNDFISVIDRED